MVDTLALLRSGEHNPYMTTSLTAVAGGRSETLTEAVARRLRGALAELQISHAEAGRRIDINPSGMSRRMKGKHPWDLDELQLLADTCGVDITYVLTGIRNAENPHPEGPGGGVVRHQGLEPRTRWYGEQPSSDELWAPVVPMFPAAPQPDEDWVAAA